jgi:thymidine kinase
MYSSKSTRLVQIYNQCKFCEIPVITINHDIDNRYDEELMSTHDQITKEIEQTVVGSENYIPVCRTCYMKVKNSDLQSNENYQITNPWHRDPLNICTDY